MNTIEQISPLDSTRERLRICSIVHARSLFERRVGAKCNMPHPQTLKKIYRKKHSEKWRRCNRTSGANKVRLR